MTNHDDRLRRGLKEEDRRLVADMPDHAGVFRLMAGSMRTSLRPFMILHFVLGTLVTGACVLSVIQVFRAGEIREQLLWSLAAIGSFVWVGFAKVFLWMQLERRAILTELRRTEVRLLDAMATRGAPVE
jgi:hypothetical protein